MYLSDVFRARHLALRTYIFSSISIANYVIKVNPCPILWTYGLVKPFGAVYSRQAVHGRGRSACMDASTTESIRGISCWPGESDQRSVRYRLLGKRSQANRSDAPRNYIWKRPCSRFLTLELATDTIRDRVRLGAPLSTVFNKTC